MAKDNYNMDGMHRYFISKKSIIFVFCSILAGCNPAPSGPGFDFDPAQLDSIPVNERQEFIQGIYGCGIIASEVDSATGDWKVSNSYDKRFHRMAALLIGYSTYHVCKNKKLAKYNYCATSEEVKIHLRKAGVHAGRSAMIKYCTEGLGISSQSDMKSIFEETCSKKAFIFIDEAISVVAKEYENYVDLQTVVYDGNRLEAAKYMYAQNCPL